MITTLNNIATQNHFQLQGASPLSGGDINQVFLLNCTEGKFVVKLNEASKFPDMFTVEAKGLELLNSSDSFKIPKVIAEGTVENNSYLLLEYIPSGNPNNHFWESFVQKLAKLHKTTNPTFGLDHNNYIGRLPQYNGSYISASKFYISQRIEPQLRMASSNGFHFSKVDTFFKNISEEIPLEVPALIHGDLWKGNYLVSEKGNPVLIDPAVAFAPREMDLGMMQLFGGFPPKVFSEYHNHFPLFENWEERVSIWQLYYLLVHLNLFGKSYLGQVTDIIKRYS